VPDLVVPLTLAEENMTAHYGRTPDGGRIPDADLDGAVRALASARGEAERVASLAAALSRDPTQTPDAAALRLRENALSAGERAANVLDAARSGLLAAIDRLDAQTAAPPQLLGAGPVEVEIRAALRGMSKGARAAALTQAFHDGDDQTLGAALRGVPLTAGLEKGEQEHWRTRYRYERRRLEAERADRLRKALGAIDRAGTGFVGFTEKAANTRQAVAAANAAGRTSAALNELTS
jgi:hypothetical protein